VRSLCRHVQCRFAKYDSVGPVHENPQHECDEDRVVRLADNRDEVRDEIEREREVRDQRGDEKFVFPRYARVTQ